jgi:hypothetical protein
MSDCFQQSRAVILAIPVMLLFVQVCSIPVSAANIDISVSGDIPQMALTPGSSNQNSSIHLNVTSDTANWTVSVKDAMDGSKIPGTEGKMANWSGSAYASSGNLAAALQVAGASIPTKTTGADVTLSGSDQLIETGLDVVTSLEIPLTFAQVVAYTDPHLTGPNHVYRIVVTFTGATT